MPPGVKHEEEGREKVIRTARSPGPHALLCLTHCALELHPPPCVRVFPVVVQGDGPIKDSDSLEGVYMDTLGRLSNEATY